MQRYCKLAVLSTLGMPLGMLCTPKQILSIYRNFLCLSAGTKSISCFPGDTAKICKLILGNLGMPGYTQPKLQSQLAEDFYVDLHVKNKVQHSLLPLDMTF